nr:hypothetical protein [Desulfuromonas thiophila]
MQVRARRNGHPAAATGLAAELVDGGVSSCPGGHPGGPGAVAGDEGVLQGAADLQHLAGPLVLQRSPQHGAGRKPWPGAGWAVLVGQIIAYFLKQYLGQARHYRRQVANLAGQGLQLAVDCGVVYGDGDHLCSFNACVLCYGVVVAR